MNHFEYGFFDELQKFATDSRTVNSLKAINRKYKKYSRDDAGRAATRTAQRLWKTTYPFQSAVQNFPNDPAGNLTVMRNQANREAGGVEDTYKYLPFPIRHRMGLKAFGL